MSLSNVTERLVGVAGLSDPEHSPKSWLPTFLFAMAGAKVTRRATPGGRLCLVHTAAYCGLHCRAGLRDIKWFCILYIYVGTLWSHEPWTHTISGLYDLSATLTSISPNSSTFPGMKNIVQCAVSTENSPTSPENGRTPPSMVSSFWALCTIHS